MANLQAEQPTLVNKVIKPPALAVDRHGRGVAFVVLAWYLWQYMANMKRKRHLAASLMPEPVPVAPLPMTPPPAAQGPPGTPQRPPRRPGPPGK